MKKVLSILFFGYASYGLAKPDFNVSLSVKGTPKDTLVIHFKTLEEKPGIWVYGIKKLVIEFGYNENNFFLGNSPSISFETITPSLSLPALGHPHGEVVIKGGSQPLVHGEYPLTINGEKYGKIRVVSDNCAKNPNTDHYVYCIKEATLVP